jgi:hypothetical protein
MYILVGMIYLYIWTHLLEVQDKDGNDTLKETNYNKKRQFLSLYKLDIYTRRSQ